MEMWTNLQSTYPTPSGNQYIDGILDIDKPSYNFELPYEGNAIVYTFDWYNPDDVNCDVYLMNSSQQDSVRSILGYVSEVTGISFQETKDDGNWDWSFLSGALPSGVAGKDFTNYSYSWNSSGYITKLDLTDHIVLDRDYSNPTQGTWGWSTLLHEMGHALGLKHPFEGAYTLPADHDHTSETVMSYNDDKTMISYGWIDLNALSYLYGGDGLRGQFGFTVT
jgi:serralysin